MPRSEPPVRVERGLYKTGETWIASVTPPGVRRPRFKTLGDGFGVMEARRRRDEWAVEVRRGGAAANQPRATFADAATGWLDQQRALVAAGELRPRTLEAYETAVRLHILPTFGNRRLRQVTPDTLVAWYADQRASGAAVWSIKARWTPLRLILGYAARHGQLDANPADLLTARERPKAGEARQRFLDDADMRALLAATAVRWRLLVAVGLFGGLRIAEVLGLTWEDIDLQAKVIRVRYQLDRQGQRVALKTGAGRRDVVLMKDLAAIARKAKLGAPYSAAGDPVFATASRRPVSIRNATRTFERTASRANLDDVTFHALRHTFASILIAQGRDVAFVSDQLGHADPSITLRVYAKLFRAEKQSNVAREQLDAEYGSLLRSAARGVSRDVSNR